MACPLNFIAGSYRASLSANVPETKSCIYSVTTRVDALSLFPLETRVFVQLRCYIYLQTQRTVVNTFLPADANKCEDARLLIEIPVFAVGNVSEVSSGHGIHLQLINGNSQRVPRPVLDSGPTIGPSIFVQPQIKSLRDSFVIGRLEARIEIELGDGIGLVGREREVQRRRFGAQNGAPLLVSRRLVADLVNGITHPTREQDDVPQLHLVLLQVWDRDSPAKGVVVPDLIKVVAQVPQVHLQAGVAGGHEISGQTAALRLILGIVGHEILDHFQPEQDIWVRADVGQLAHGQGKGLEASEAAVCSNETWGKVAFDHDREHVWGFLGDLGVDVEAENSRRPMARFGNQMFLFLGGCI